MTTKRKPTSALLHEAERLQDAVFVACREGHIHDLKKLRPKYNAAKEAYEKRLQEDANALAEKEYRRQEREAAREAKRIEKERKKQEREEKKRLRDEAKAQKQRTR